MKPPKRRWLGGTTKVRKLRLLFSGAAREVILSERLCQDTAASELPEKMYWIEQIIQWLFQGELESGDARFRYFLGVLDKNPKWRLNFQRTVSGVLAESRFLGLFSQIELAIEHGLWGDTLNRFIRKVLPASGSTDFHETLLNVLSREDRIRQIESISDETLLRLRELVFRPEDRAIWADLRSESQEASQYLCAHVAHYGLSAEIRRRLPRAEKLSASPFLRLGQAVAAGDRAQIESLLSACEHGVAEVYRRLEESGVSVDAVNRLETLLAMLEQVRRLIALNAPAASLAKSREVLDFLKLAALAGVRSRAVFGHIRRHFYLLSKKIVERNGESGEHYIAHDRSELKALFRSSIGGGAIVVGMTILKIWIILAQPAPLFLAIGLWAVYSAGFLAMQFSGTTLATKIPSFTASRLAGILFAARRQDQAPALNDFRNEFRFAIRSQALALLGNVLGLVPVALVLNYLFRQAFGQGVLMPEPYANHVLRGLHPVFSFAMPLAALTGVELWLSSMAGGWFENWVVFNRLPNAIQYHFHIRKFFGVAAGKRLADWLLKNSSGIATNLSLGFLFGFVPLLGGLLGLDWSGNHVTISTTSAVFALASLPGPVSLATALWTFTGLVLIGVMNFLLSFGIALWVAGSSQNLQIRRVLRYLRSGLANDTDDRR